MKTVEYEIVPYEPTIYGIAVSALKSMAVYQVGHGLRLFAPNWVMKLLYPTGWMWIDPKDIHVHEVKTWAWASESCDQCDYYEDVYGRIRFPSINNPSPVSPWFSSCMTQRWSSVGNYGPFTTPLFPIQ